MRTRNYKVIRYSDEHIHILQNHGDHIREQCVMSQNWSRCTATPIDLADYRTLRGQDRSYYDGNRWTKAELSDYCSDCQRGGQHA